jgi:hypothetical protein
LNADKSTSAPKAGAINAGSTSVDASRIQKS